MQPCKPIPSSADRYGKAQQRRGKQLFLQANSSFRDAEITK